jgi:hypothetical protein
MVTHTLFVTYIRLASMLLSLRESSIDTEYEYE